MTLHDVQDAADRVLGKVHFTPVMTSERLNEIADAEVFFKCENLQKAGAFKARGAVNAVFSLDEAVISNGVATHSSGNHGAALARAAGLRGIPSYIVVPSNAKQVKKDAIRGYSAEVIECEPTLAARESTLAEVVKKTGATEVHPYNQKEIIAGQGTAGLELVSQVYDLDAIVTPVGGGGLMAGCCLVAEARGIKLYGAEPAGAADAKQSFDSGNLVTEHVPDTICDGLLTTVGQLNFEIIQRVAEDILVVDDAAVIEAMRYLWTRTKLVVEPSSAVAFAVVLANPALFEKKRIGVVLTGGNVDLDHLPFN